MGFDGRITFAGASPFQHEVKRRVDAYFVERGLSRGANAAMAAKIVFWICFAWGAWALLLAQVVSWPWALALYALQGFGLACVGFNVGHDAIHGSLSERPRVNALLSWTFDMMGASSKTWALAHNHLHHTWTNVVGVDSDLEPGPWMAFYPAARRSFHRWQHWYAWFFYALIGFVWMYRKDFAQALRVDPRTGKKADAATWAQLLAGKALHLVLLLVLPFVFIEEPWWRILLGYAVMLSCAGVTLATVFQLAHCVEGTVFVPAAPKIEEGWADHQMRTTANFGNTPLTTFITGGLDHQIEHHLFPRVCHIHYRAIAPIVKQCALEHGLPYIHNGSYWQALASHARTMRRIGRGEPLPVGEVEARPLAVAQQTAAAAE